MNDRSTDCLSPGGWGVLNASQLTLSQGLSSSMLMTRKCNKISADVLLVVSTGAIASIFCVYLLTVEVLDTVKERLDTWATVVYTSVSESFRRLTVDVFLEALTTSRTQNCASICNNKSNCPSDEKVIGERRFPGLRLFDMSPTENSENESFIKRNKVDFLQKLAIWSEATDGGFLPSTTPFICTPNHLEDTLRCDAEGSGSVRSRAEGEHFALLRHPSDEDKVFLLVRFVLSFQRALSRCSFC